MSDRTGYSSLRLRAATYDDRRLLFDWRNDPVVRQASFTTAPVAWEDHVKWFDRMMTGEDVRQYILVDASCMPLGQIRIRICDGNPSAAEIGYSVDAAVRGHGYGRALLELIIPQVLRDLPQVRMLIGRVKKDNLASASAFAAAGYEPGYEFGNEPGHEPRSGEDSLIYRYYLTDKPGKTL